VSNGRRSLDALLRTAGIDPAAGVQVVDATRLPAVPFDPSLPLIVLAAPHGEPGATLPGRHHRAGIASVLARLYPPEHPAVRLDASPDAAVPGAGALGAGTLLHRQVGELTDDELRTADWYLAPLDPLDNLASPHGMAAISARLRAPNGCPWDRKQTHATLRPFVLEEAYETVDAIEQGTPGDLAEELGDLFLQIILHAQLAAEEGTFDLADVYRTLGAKIIRRHPHVFGDLEVHEAEQVLRNWEAIKVAERGEAGREPSAFSGVARALPALAGSREIQERASALGWDWASIDGVWEKVHEELEELHEAGAAPAGDGAARDAQLHELGDLLFALVNLSRWMKLDPEEALRTANRRWIERYEAVEALAAERGVDLAALDLDGKDRLWDEVKARR
jgi:MazG family protein